MHAPVTGRGRGAAITIFTLAVLAGALGAGSAPGSQGEAARRGGDGPDRPAATARAPLATAIRSDGAVERWTPQRMRAAPANELGAGVTAAASAPALASFSSKTLRNTRAYPNRVHGRLFGAFRDPGRGRVDFGCSATVISSGSGNLIATAGHCVFDHELGGFVVELVFVPGYNDGEAPFGAFEGTNVVTPGAWTSLGNLDHDLALVQLAPDRRGRDVAEIVGSRGIGFEQPSRGPSRKLAAFGYPASPARYDGERLVRCRSQSFDEPIGHSSNPSLGMGCDMRSGASGGGWVAQNSFVVANTSHGHPGEGKVIYGPHYGGTAKRLYRFADAEGFPSVGPVTCGGRAATIVGSDASEVIRGSKGKDVIATLGGRDVVRSKGGDDRICLGNGDDRIDGGAGTDLCDGGAGRDRAAACERTRRIP